MFIMFALSLSDWSEFVWILFFLLGDWQYFPWCITIVLGGNRGSEWRESNRGSEKRIRKWVKPVEAKCELGQVAWKPRWFWRYHENSYNVHIYLRTSLHLLGIWESVPRAEFNVWRNLCWIDATFSFARIFYFFSFDILRSSLSPYKISSE